MMNSNPFENLNFNAAPKLRIGLRALFLIGILVVYAIAWGLIPSSTFFWLGLPILLSLAWAASFGWREALSNLSLFFQRLERF